MDFDTFERHARDAYEEIPETYLDGIDGLVVSKEAPTHPDYPDVFTLGQCLTEEHLSDFGSPETTRSVIALYWGSFAALASKNPDFDWAGEIWETLTHELRHHLESLAGDDALEAVDYAADQTFKRQDGAAFDPWYYQQGEPLGAGAYGVETDVYIEIEWEPGTLDREREIHFEWAGVRYVVPRPEPLGDHHFLYVGELGGRRPVELVLVRRQRWWESLLGLFVGERAVIESSAEAVPVGG